MSNNNQIIAGIDEAGRGPLFGPVVACAVIFNEKIDITEIKDSKKISASKRQKVYDKLIQENINYKIGIVNANEIDEINILNATKKAMLLAVNNLSIRPYKLLIDGNQLIKTSINQEAVVKGDQKVAEISAASIIAKVKRDKIIESYNKIYPMFQLSKHKGYGTKLHFELLNKYGPSEIHRQTFKPVSGMINSNDMKKHESMPIIRFGINLINKGFNLKELTINEVFSVIKYFNFDKTIYVLSLNKIRKDSVILNFIETIKEKDSVNKVRIDVIYSDDFSKNPKIKYSCKIY